MHALDLIPLRRLDYEPPSTCHDFGIGEAAAALSALAAGGADAAGAAAVGMPALSALGGGVAANAAAAAAAGLPAVAGASSLALPSLGAVGSIVSGAGTLLSAKAGMDNAAYQASLQRSEATALAQKANDDAAAGERAQITQQRQTDLVMSRARALAAGSGTDATSPDVVNTEGRIQQQGDYNALSSLYQGQQRSRADNYQSNIDLFNANRIETGAPLAATGTILSGLSSFVDKRARLRYFTSNPDANPFAFGAV